MAEGDVLIGWHFFPIPNVPSSNSQISFCDYVDIIKHYFYVNHKLCTFQLFIKINLSFSQKLQSTSQKIETTVESAFILGFDFFVKRINDLIKTKTPDTFFFPAWLILIFSVHNAEYCNVQRSFYCNNWGIFM